VKTLLLIGIIFIFIIVLSCSQMPSQHSATTHFEPNGTPIHFYSH